MNDIKDPSVAEYLSIGSDTPIEVARAVLVFGKNSATYKFALAKTLLELNPSSEMKYGDIGQIFLKHLVEHHQICPHQHNRGETKLTRAIDDHLAGKLPWDRLFDVAEESIYNNVFDAFHKLGGGEIERSAALFEHDREHKKITLTDSLNSLQENEEVKSVLLAETEARWRVVEEAWRKNVSPNLILDTREKSFYTTVNEHRVNLRSAVDTLMPYQYGKCFYCSCPLNKYANQLDDQFPDVDHVLPLSLIVRQYPAPDFNPNGVWNLVLSCRRCNRGVNGKMDQKPHERFYQQLEIRNVYFTKEHKHSMRFSVLTSLNASNASGVTLKMREIYKPFHFFSGWQPNG